MSGLILITGRTARQALAMHRGKGSDAYRQEVASIEMAPRDMEQLGLEPGRQAVVRTSHGEVQVTVRGGDLPPGVVFMPLGPWANALVGIETFGTGMPSFKGLAVEVEAL